MKFSKYVEQELKKLNSKGEQKYTKTQYLTEFAERSGVSLLTLQNIDRGSKLVNYNKAKDVSKATKGAVTVKDLCED